MPSTFLSDQVSDAQLSRGGHPATIADILTAQSQGAAAVHEGSTPGRCPYRADHTPRGRFLALMWFRGYQSEREQLRSGGSGGE